jgi:hypothetical protein
MLRRVISSLLTAVVLAALLAPAASADETTQKGLEGSFTLKGTHGYTIKALIGATGNGDAGLMILSVGKKGEEATYLVHGTVTKEAVDFDLGELGEVKAAVQPTGTKETLIAKCASGEKQTIEGSEYVGAIAFHGEEGFTEVEATHAPLVLSAFDELLCSGGGEGRESGEGLPGVGLSIKRKGGPSLSLSQNHPGARVFYSADMSEKEGAVTVDRTVVGSLVAGSLSTSSSLKTARFNGTAPFSGAATYKGRSLPHKTLPGEGSWRGSLTVDFPGNAAVPLAGPGFKASIIPTRREKPHSVKP